MVDNIRQLSRKLEEYSFRVGLFVTADSILSTASASRIAFKGFQMGLYLHETSLDVLLESNEKRR